MPILDFVQISIFSIFGTLERGHVTCVMVKWQDEHTVVEHVVSETDFFNMI